MRPCVDAGLGEVTISRNLDERWGSGIKKNWKLGSFRKSLAIASFSASRSPIDQSEGQLRAYQAKSFRRV